MGDLVGSSFPGSMGDRDCHWRKADRWWAAGDEQSMQNTLIDGCLFTAIFLHEAMKRMQGDVTQRRRPVFQSGRYLELCCLLMGITQQCRAQRRKPQKRNPLGKGRRELPELGWKVDFERGDRLWPTTEPGILSLPHMNTQPLE